jgi:hypothetical protein
MADEFISVPIEYDESALYQTAVQTIQSVYPNWTPRSGSLVDMVLRVTAAMAAIGAENAASVIPDIFQYFGKLAKVPPIRARPAMATVRFTVQDAAGGYVIEGGTPVGLKTSTMEDAIGFTTGSDLTIAVGATTGEIGVIATEAGADANNLDTIIRADSYPFIIGVELLAPSSNGLDEELTEDYLNRLSLELETWTKTPIIESNFAVLAPSLPGIYRAAAWENYNPADDTTGNEKYVTVCPIDVNGAAVSVELKNALQNLLLGLRETNFICPVIDPTPNVIDVSYLATVDPSFDIPSVEAAVQTALAELLNPARWGMPARRSVVPVWKNTKTVTINQVIQTIQAALGGNDSSNVRIGPHGGTLLATDHVMTGAFPLASLGDVTATVTY